MASIEIRLAARRHLSDVPKIELAAATMFPVVDLSEALRYKVTPLSELRRAMADDRLWVALHAGSAIGFAMASVVDHTGYLDELGVMPDFGRQGTGRLLVSEVTKWARGKGFASLTLITFRHLAWNAPFYEKLGFRGMDPAEHGEELTGLIEEERLIGINTGNRIAMRLAL